MEESKTGSGAPVEELKSGAPSSEPKEEPVKQVPLENHRRAIDDMHKFKTRAAELEAKLTALEEEKLKETENYKALAERYKADADSNKQKLEKWSQGFSKFQKLTAVQAAAQEAGLISADDLESVDLSSIDVEETSSGRYILHGVKDLVEDVKKKKPHWFKKEKAPVVNSGGGGAKPAGDARVTAQDVNEMERKFKRGLVTKDQYHAVFTKWRTQSKS
jgi:hypothetical protein